MKNWYQNEDWPASPDAMEEFFRRLQRVRHPWQVLFIKAQHLLSTGDAAKRDVALAVLMRGADEDDTVESSTFSVREQLAKTYFTLERFEDAEREFRQCIALHEREAAKGSDAYPADLPPGWSLLDELGRTLVQLSDKRKRDDGIRCFEQYYRIHNYHEYVAYTEVAARLTRPLATYRNGADGLWKVDCPLLEIAWQDKSDLRERNPDIVAAVDRHLRAHPLLLTFKSTFVWSELLPELGIFVGNLLVQKGAEWDAPRFWLTLADGRDADPLWMAFKMVYFYYPLRYLMTEVTGENGNIKS